LGAERLRECAREHALTQEYVARDLQGATPLLGMVEAAALDLFSCNRVLANAVRLEQPISPASEWLLDNYYLIEEQVRTVREDLPEDYGIELPYLTAGPCERFPRVYEAVVALIAHTDARVDEEYLRAYVDGYQDALPLSIGEIWAVPIMMRISLVENLSRLARRVVDRHIAERTADKWADRLLLTAQDAPDTLRDEIEALEVDDGTDSPAFFLRLSQRLQGQETGSESIQSWLGRKLDGLGVSIDHVAHEQQQEQASDQVSIANSITAVRFLDAYNWDDFFEHASFVEHILREDPAGVYPRMNFRSRDRYRHALEAMARRCPHNEIQVAEAVMGWSLQALSHNASDPVRGHVGHYLISAGRYDLERSIDYVPLKRERFYRGPLSRHGLFYWGMLGTSTALLAVLLGCYAVNTGARALSIIAIVLISLIPLSDLAANITNRVSAWLFPPRILPKLDYHEPVSSAHRTLSVVPALLSSVNATRSIIDRLEVAYLANADPMISFGILGDLKASDQPHRADDDAIVEAAVTGIHRLNARYLGEHGREPFNLFIRGRTQNTADKSWMGWERKRGALVELCRALRGATDTSFTHRIGDASFHNGVTFVITLDADTVLPRDGARKLIATIAHPLNRARYSPEDRRVMHGYGLVQPRVSMSLTGSSRSFFAWLYSGITGVDPYASAVSDTYQDVFGEGSFTGKGIFEVNIFNGVLEGRFPENALLSHDLIEGNYLRTALASDVEVYDDFPASYASQAARMHRWVRGDWQTLPWLGVRVPAASGKNTSNPLSLLHRWKMIDNLRRSLVAPSLLALITVGWLLLPEQSLGWPLAMTAIVLFPAYFSLADSMLFQPHVGTFAVSAHTAWRDLCRDSARALLTLTMLPHQAWLMLDAILRSIWRMTVSHKNLLEWETADDADRRLGNARAGFVHRMWRSSLLGGILIVAGTALDPARLLAATPLVLLWAAAPLVAWRVSIPAEPAEEPLSGSDRSDIRTRARMTWRFFDTFITQEGHWLAPDNYQEDPKGEVAWRTSPTNVGLQLLGYLTAYDLGYITVAGLMERSANTLSTMVGLRRFKGHFYNWYDIKTLEPLPPHYISTVDSGNLAGHLLILRVGLLEASESPLLGPQIIDGVADTVRLALRDLFAEKSALGPEDAVRRLREILEELARNTELEERPANLGEWASALERLNALADSAGQLIRDISGPQFATVPGNELSVPVSPIDRMRASIAEVVSSIAEPVATLERCAPWASLTASAPGLLAEDPRAKALDPILELVPSLVGLAEGLDVVMDTLSAIALDPPGEGAEAEHVVSWARETRAGILESRPACVHILAQLRIDADMARAMWEHADFKVLFDPQRLLFSIGFNTTEGRLDRSFYDMLASECRLASFLAIAKGDVPQEHWFRLGRSITQTGNGRALLSWSASMFEYLMPLLVMRTWPQTLLDETYGAVVRRQIAYGRELHVPWGVSESAFNAKDAELTYQYQAFGVPGLGLKRGLSEDTVIAPYASILALDIDRQAVLSNLRVLTEQGAEGRFGFYEAIDFTPGRIPAGERRAVVKAYFAHHQGMGFVALANALTDNRMRQRFHADPMVSSAELLLQERVPRNVQLAQPNVEEVEHVRSVRELPPPVARSYPLADTPVPSTHFLSNGSYSVMVTNGGGGYSRWSDLAVTRYREDVTRDCWGTFLFLRDVDSGETWSATANPSPKQPDDYHVTFAPDKAEFRRTDGSIETRTEIAVSPEHDVEIRRVVISNRGMETRTVEVTSYLEIALTQQASDQAHKSFSNLFVETEALPDTSAILFSRRPRSSEEARVWGFHLLACDSADECEWSFETDRARFIGRLHSINDPIAVRDGGALSNTVGAVLDPSCSIRKSVTIPAGGSARLIFTTGVSPERDEAIRLTEIYHDIRSGQRAIDLAWTAAQIELRDMGITPEGAVTLERLASRLLLTDPYSPLKIKTPVENGLQVSGLWSIGISGDNPILLVRVDQLEHAPLVRHALLAHQYWRHKGLVSDLVILNTRPTAYSDSLDERLRLLVRTGHALQLQDKPGGVFLRRADQMHPDVANLLEGVARATLDGESGSLDLQLARRGHRPDAPPPLVPEMDPVADEPTPFVRPTLMYDNGYGGFDAEAGEYVIVMDDDRPVTPAPWINVMASPDFGAMVSEAGIGCTWAKNSHENRITTWNNDPVSDGSGEALYLRDEETGEFWSPTPLPVRDSEPYVVRHGKGYTRFEHESHGIVQSIDWFVSADEPIRVVRLTLENRTDRVRRLSATQFVEWALGSSRSKAQHQVVTWFDAENDMLTAHNHLNFDFPGRPSFLACDREIASWTASRTDFVGRNRMPSDPAAMYRKRLDFLSGRYHDNCGALMTRIDLEPGEAGSVTFLLGQADDLEAARTLVRDYRSAETVDRSLSRIRAQWDSVLGSLTVRTPDGALDLMVNGQLLYQALACRLWGRTAAYQSSGAYGFRDQLQDTLCMLMSRPDLVREQILEASRHQFERGDVLHWWQPISGRGVRTRISDDRHWLPFVVAEYIRSTGDTSILHERTAFIEGQEIEPDREDVYMQPAISEKSATVYEHCLRALEAGRPTGVHGLPLISGGDWNDGMNRVGHHGEGESVWLGWFLNVVLTRFAPVCEIMGDEDIASDYRKWAEDLVTAIEAESWDGQWYRRAYFDDGTPLGSKDSDECRIDAIAQAWATISGAGDPERAEQALDSVSDRLVRRDAKLIALLSPPFDHMKHDPGYIKGYVPGVRENGGQYTHAATWVILAFLLQGEGDEALSLLDLVNPINHALDESAADVYKVEPFVVAADVYATSPHVGRGGWTWYTGSASWFYRVAVNHLLGIEIVAMDGERHLTFNPCIPKRWPSFEMNYRAGETEYRITVENPRGVNRGVAHVMLDGERLSTNEVMIVSDGLRHEVVVTLLGG
jgi:cyclic beta-1,2-glucan synthetase